MRTFDGRHPSWRSQVHLLDNDRIHRVGRDVGHFEFEDEGRTLRLCWDHWEPEVLSWAPGRQCYASPSGEFTLRELQVPPRPGELVVGVLACGHDAYRRRRARCLATWIPCLERAGVTVLFLVGVEDAVDEPRIAAPAEHGRAGFELWLPCGDAYHDVTWKVIWFTRWAVENGRFRFLFKCDDDTYVVPRRLIEAIPKEHDYTGYGLSRGVPYAAGGGGYFLSRRAAEIVSRSETDGGLLEDRWVGELLASQGVPLEHDERFIPVGSAARRPRPDNDLVTDHQFGPTWELHDVTWAGRPELYHPLGVHSGLLARPGTEIPRTLHMACLDEGEPTRRFLEIVESWRRLHPGWDVRVHRPDDLPTPIAVRRVGRADDRRVREDALAFEMLYREGGVWVSQNVECRASVAPLLGGVDAFATTDQSGAPTTEVVGARPRHPVVAEVVASLAGSAEDVHAADVLGRFRERSDLTLLPWCQFPLDREDVPIGDLDTYAVGLCPR